MHENVCDTTKVYECFYEDFIIEGSIYLDILELFAFPQLKTLEAVVFCIGQGLSVVMSDNIVLNTNFLINKLGTVNLHSGLKEGEVIHGKYVHAEKFCDLCHMEEKIYIAIVIIILDIHNHTCDKVEFHVNVWRATKSAHIEACQGC